MSLSDAPELHADPCRGTPCTGRLEAVEVRGALCRQRSAPVDQLAAPNPADTAKPRELGLP